MSRRTTVLVTGTVLLLLFGVLGALLPVPYVAQVPGPTYNTLGDIDGTPIISLTGREPNDTSGNLNLTTVGIQQNDQMQKISAWGAILVVPSLLAGIFGMNFEEAWWMNARYGFEIMIALMVLIAAVLYVSFKRAGWL